MVKCKDCKNFRDLELSDVQFMCWNPESIYGACESTSSELKRWRDDGIPYFCYLDPTEENCGYFEEVG